MEVKDNIRKLRKAKKISQTELADEIGLSCAAISSYETGAHVPPLDIIRKLAAFFDVSITEITGDEWYSNPTTADTAQELFENPDLRMLFDAARDSRPEDLQMAADLLRRLKATNPD